MFEEVKLLLVIWINLYFRQTFIIFVSFAHLSTKTNFFIIIDLLLIYYFFIIFHFVVISHLKTIL